MNHLDFERFSDDGRHVIFRAYRFAIVEKKDDIGLRQLLLGILATYRLGAESGLDPSIMSADRGDHIN